MTCLTHSITSIAIFKVNLLLKTHYNKKLSPEQKLIFCCLWKDLNFSDISKIHGRYTSYHLKHIANNLWQLLSFALNEEVDRNNFKQVLIRHYPDIAPKTENTNIKPKGNDRSDLTNKPKFNNRNLKKILKRIDELRAIDDSSLSNYLTPSNT